MWQQVNKLPAWISLSEGSLPNRVPATKEETDWLKKLLNEEILVERIEFAGSHLQMYWAKGGVFGEFLIKYLPSSKCMASNQAYELAGWLSNKGCLTPLPLKIVDLNGDGFLHLYKYHIHRLLKPIKSDMCNLSNSLALLHHALNDHPAKASWKDNTQNRLFSLLNIRRLLADGILKVGPRPTILSKIAQNKKLDFVRSDLPYKALHGDMNYRNVFASTKKSGTNPQEVMILDFEDVQHSFLPEVFELALIIERFIMVNDLDDNVSISLAKNFLESYQDSISIEFDIKSIDWLNVIQSLNLRSLCVLSLIESEGGEIPGAEWHKFFDLFKRSQQQAYLWNSLDPLFK